MVLQCLNRQIKKEILILLQIKCEQPFLVSETTVEIEDNKGSKIKICFKGKPDFDLMNLAKAFLDNKL